MLSWWGRPDVPHTHDGQGVRSDDAIAMVLDAALAVDMRVAFHLEPYQGRDAASVAADFAYIAAQYGGHGAVLRAARTGGGDGATPPPLLPVCYVYDSWHIAAAEWARVLTPRGDLSVRGGRADVVAIGLWLERRHGAELADGGFDGAYTYFASDGFSYGATSSAWRDQVRSGGGAPRVSRRGGGRGGQR